SRGEFQGHDRGVDVADGADRVADERRAEREELDRLLPHQPADTVEVVDDHVAEEAAGAREIVGRGRLRIAHRVVDHLDAADAAGLDVLPGGLIATIEVPLKADLHANAGPLDGGDGLVGGGEIEGDRLLGEDVLAGRGGGDDAGRVGVGGRGDHDGIDIGVVEGGAGIGGDLRHTEVVRELPGEILARVDDHGEGAQVAETDERTGVDLADAADADEGNVGFGCHVMLTPFWKSQANVIVMPHGTMSFRPKRAPAREMEKSRQDWQNDPMPRPIRFDPAALPERGPGTTEATSQRGWIVLALRASRSR